MVTVYSLVCWQGRVPATVTFTDAGDVVNLTAHNGSNGLSIQFPDNSGNTLPTGLSKDTTYYLGAGADANKFLLYPTKADAIAATNKITFTGTGSGTHKVISAFWATLSVAGRARYGTAGSERVYASLSALVTARNAITDFSIDDVYEIATCFTDTTVPASLVGKKSIVIHTKINGVRDTEAHHYGLQANGYKLWASSQYAPMFSISHPDVIIDGLNMKNTFSTSQIPTIFMITTASTGLIVRNCIIETTRGCGINTGAQYGVQIYNNLILNCEVYGINAATTDYSVIMFNHVHGCGTGFFNIISQYALTNGFYYGNISVGNTINWATMDFRSYTAGNRFYGTLNFGDSTDIKTVTFENSSTPGTLTCRLTGHTFTANQPLRFTGASLPTGITQGTLYYIKTAATDTFTLTATLGGTAITYTNSGSGTITISMIWDTQGTSSTLATTDFVDYTNHDFRPAAANSPQVDLVTYSDGDGFPRTDIADLYRPDYVSATYPTNYGDVGAFEYDHGEGNTPPNYQDIVLTGLISGSRVKIKKSSDGTSLYNAVVNDTSLTVNVDMGVANYDIKIYVRKGSAAPFYYPYYTTATVSYLTGLSLSISQIPDIACSTYPAGVATDWAVDTGTKVISNAAGTTVYTVQELYSWLCNYYDDESTVDLDIPMYGTTPTVFGLQNSGSISDADMELLNGGSLLDGTTLWSNVYTVGTQAANTQIYLHVDGVAYTSYWSTGNIDVMIKLPLWDGTEVVDIRAHKYTDTYDHWNMTISTDGRQVAAIATSDDANNQTSSVTVAGYSDISITFNNPTNKQIDAEDTPGNYKVTINGAGRTVQQIYEYLKYVTREDSAYSLNGVAGNIYVSTDASYAEVKSAPLGTFAGGVYFGAKGVWLENVATADALNYILTDNSGVTHQAAAQPVSIAVTNIVSGSRIQVYDLTNSIQLANEIVSGTSFSLVKSYTSDLDIRVRLTYISGASTAYEWYESQGTFSSTGMSLRASQVANSVYTTNGIDGSTVTECSVSGTTIRIYVDDPDNTTSAQRIYNWYQYMLFTEAGIRDQDGANISATDSTHYVFADSLKIINQDTVNPLNLTGANIVPTTGNATNIFDLTNGASIALNFNRVEGFAYSSGSGLSTEEHNKLLAIPSTTLLTDDARLNYLDAPVSSASAPTAVQVRQEIDNNSTKLKFIKNNI